MNSRFLRFLAALGLGLGALALAFRNRPGGIVRYTIKGKVEVINDCDGLQASIPNPIKIKTNLRNQNNSAGGSQRVTLAPDPADPPNTPRLIGTYSITVAWLANLAAPTEWETPSATKPDDTDICRSINCPAGRLCDDIATRTRTVPFVNPTTTCDVKVSCACT